jgi:hypothetical protein
LKYIWDYVTVRDHGKGFIRIPLYECTTDEIKKLASLYEEKQEALIELLKMTPEKLFLSRINNIKV